MSLLSTGWLAADHGSQGGRSRVDNIHIACAAINAVVVGRGNVIFNFLLSPIVVLQRARERQQQVIRQLVAIECTSVQVRVSFNVPDSGSEGSEIMVSLDTETSIEQPMLDALADSQPEDPRFRAASQTPVGTFRRR